MIRLLFYFLLLLMVSCKAFRKNEKPSWLLGNWTRINNKPTHATYEHWNKDFTGIGYTLKEQDTTFKESMSIITQKNTLYLKVTGVNKNPTLFKFTSQTDTSFVCVNPTNEFPKNIKYWISNSQLYATVWNDDTLSVDFIFKKENDLE